MNDFKHYRGRGRGQFPHNNNFRGNVFNNVRRTNPNTYSPLLPLPPFRENKHRWTRPQHNPIWQRPPRLMPPFLRPPNMANQLVPSYIQDSKPPSPLPGSEEARQKAIAEASARIKQQLNLNENESGGVTSEQIPSPNYTSFSDNKYEEIEEIPYNKPEKNLRRRNRKSTESTHTVEELRNKILTQFTSMSKGKIQNLVNNPGSSKYDNYLHHLVRDMRLHLSTELRNMYNNRENDTENNEMIDHFNSIIPDLGVELVSLPDTMVAELSKILQFDINNEISSSPINEPLVEPEHMFKQAEKLLLNTDYLNNSFEMCVPQVSDNFSTESTANLIQNHVDSFLQENPIPPVNSDTVAIDNCNNTIATQILPSQDSSSNLDEIPLPDSNQQGSSRTPSPFSKHMSDNTNIINDNTTATTCVAPAHSSEQSETNLGKNIQTLEINPVWAFNNISKTLCDTTRNEYIEQHTNNKIKPEPDPDLDESFKPNRLPLDERIKMMMKMQESNPRKLQEDKGQLYKSKNQKKKERKRLKQLQKRQQEKMNARVKIENTDNSPPVDYHLNVIVKQEIFDEEEMNENQSNSMNTFIQHVKELNNSLNKSFSPTEVPSPRPFIEVRKNLMPSSNQHLPLITVNSPTSVNKESHEENQYTSDKDERENQVDESYIAGNNQEEERGRNESETPIETACNEIPVIDNTTDDLATNSKPTIDPCELLDTTTDTMNKDVDKEESQHQDNIPKEINETQNVEVLAEKSGTDINEQQCETVNTVLNDKENIQKNSTEVQDKIIEDYNNQQNCTEEKDVLNADKMQESSIKENIEKTEENVNKVEENISGCNTQNQKEEINTTLKCTENKPKETEEELNTEIPSEKKECNEENKEIQHIVPEVEHHTTHEQSCNIDKNIITIKADICDKIIKENNIQEKVEKQTDTHNKMEKESSKKHRSDDKKRDKSLEKDYKKSDRGNSAERRVSDKHYRHRSKEKHRESKESESSKYRSDKSKSKTKTDQKSSGKTQKKSDDRKENKIELEMTGDSSKMLNRLMEIDLQIQKLMQEKFYIYQKLNFSQHTNIITSAIPESQQTVQINTSTNSQSVAEETEQKNIEKNNKNKSSLEIETPKKLRKRKRSPTPHHSPDIEPKKCNEIEVKIESEKPIKKKGKFDKKPEVKISIKKTVNKETVPESDTVINEIATENTLVPDKDVKENKKSSKNEKKDRKKINENTSTVTITSTVDEPVEESAEKIENKSPKKRRTKTNQSLNENVTDEPNKKILIKIKKPVKKTSKKQAEDNKSQETKLEITETCTASPNEIAKTETKIESPEIKEKKSKKKRKGEIINNNVEENKIETTREESNECTEENIDEIYNNNNENTEYKIKLKVSEPSSDNKSIRLKIIKSEIKKEDPDNDKLSTLRRSRRNTSEEIQNSEKIIPASLTKKKRKPDEEHRRSRSRSMSKDPEKKPIKCMSSDEDEPLGRQIKRRPISGSDSESSCVNEKRVDKKINAKRKTRRLSRDSDISIAESVKSNKSVPENNSLINCFVKLERCDVNTNSTTSENTSTSIVNSELTSSDATEDVDKDIHDIIAKLDDNFEDSIGEIEGFHVNNESIKPELEIISSDNDPAGIFCAGHQKSILDIKILGDEFLAASEDGTIYKYCLKTGELQDAYTGHKRAVTCIHLMGGSVLDITSSLLYSGSLDCTLRCFNLDTAEVLHSVTVEQAIQCMDSAWGHIFLGTYEGLLFIYNIKKKLLNDQSLTIANATVLMIKATTEGSRQVLILASRKREIMVRDAFTGLLLRTMCQDQKPTIYSLLLDKSMVYCGTSDKGIFILDFNNGTQIGLYNSGKGVVCMVMYKNLLFAGCYDGMIYVYNTKTQKHLSSISGPGDGMLLSLAISHDMIIAGTKKDHLLKIWKIPQEILNQIHQ